MVDDEISSYDYDQDESIMGGYALDLGYGDFRIFSDETLEMLPKFHKALVKESDNGVIKATDLEKAVSNASKSIGLNFDPDKRDEKGIEKDTQENQRFAEQGI
ncbi:MAG: hypothetical protein ACQESG_05295 [Nanobdellota archaeon]